MNKSFEKNISAIEERWPELAKVAGEYRIGEKDVSYERISVNDKSVLIAQKDERVYQLDTVYDNSALLDIWYSNIEFKLREHIFIIFGLGNGDYIRKIVSEADEEIPFISTASEY